MRASCSSDVSDARAHVVLRAGPALIFCENKADVDDIHEFLLLKGCDAVSSHGGKSQEDREYATKAFKMGK
eukprot:477807-Rhodomonas_salina.1